jgi:hypothetical protein
VAVSGQSRLVNALVKRQQIVNANLTSVLLAIFWQANGRFVSTDGRADLDACGRDENMMTR